MEVSDVFNQDRLLETVCCRDFLLHGAVYLQLKLCSRGKSPPSREKHICCIQQDTVHDEALSTQVLLVLILQGRDE